MSPLYALCYLLSLLPFRLLYLISDFLFIVIYYGIGYRKAVVMQNLTHVFTTKTTTERKKLAKAFYKQLCDLLVEHIKALTLSPKALLKQVTVSHLHSLIPFYKQEKSIMLVAGHFGNWEWAAHTLALQTPYKLCAGYQPLHQKSLDTIVLNLRTRFQRKALPIRALLRHSLTYKGPPQAITLLIDQAPLANGYKTTFLRQTTTIDLTAAKLAQKYNYPIFYIQITKSKRGKYHIKPILLTSEASKLSVETIATLYTKRLETSIMNHPSLWLWSHRRWK